MVAKNFLGVKFFSSGLCPLPSPWLGAWKLLLTDMNGNCSGNLKNTTQENLNLVEVGCVLCPY